MAEQTPSEHTLDIPPETPPPLHYNHIITNPLGATDQDLNRDKVEFAPSTFLEARELPAPVPSPPLAPLPNTSYPVSASSRNVLSSPLLSPSLHSPSPSTTSSLCFHNISYSVAIRRHPLAFLPAIPSLRSSIPRNSSATDAPTDVPVHTSRHSQAPYNHNQQSGKQQQQQRRSILQGISGSAKAGQVTAIMGASGSGKTTLLDILSHRISLPSTPLQIPSAPEPLPSPSASPPPDIPPSITPLPTPTTALSPSISRNGAPVTALSSSTPALSSSITLNGAPVTASTMRRVSAYVMQDDLLFPALTVRETLLFAAELRLGNGRVGRRAKEEKVEGLMRLLGLTRVADSRIGDENRSARDGRHDSMWEEKVGRTGMCGVMQDDLLFPALTVRETLLFAAELRLGNGRVGRRAKEEKVEGLMRLLGLTRVADSRIGNENRSDLLSPCSFTHYRGVSGGERKWVAIGVKMVGDPTLLLVLNPGYSLSSSLFMHSFSNLRGVSGGERKRVAIGVEMVGDPSLLFLDEPTSGLDSTCAFRACSNQTPPPFPSSLSSPFRGVSDGERKRVAIGVEMVGDPTLLFLDEPTSGLDSTSVSGGERKRVAIGVEMVGDPTLLFLDEPTSGLDSTCAFHVVKAVRDVARLRSSIVLMVLHQPSFRVLNLLDNLLLLGSGHTVFSGCPSELPGYLTDFGCPVPPFSNPVEFTLDLIQSLQMEGQQEGQGGLGGESGQGGQGGLGGVRGARGQEGGNVGRKGQDGQEGKGRLKGGEEQEDVEAQCGVKVNGVPQQANGGAGTPGIQRLADFHREWLWVLTARSAIVIRRTPALYLLRLLLIMITGLLIASLFWQPEFNTRGVHERLAFIAFLTCTLFFSSGDATPLFIQERNIFVRETTHNAYRPSTYLLASTLVYLPLHLLMSLAITLEAWWCLSLTGGAAGLAFMVLVCFCCLFTGNAIATFVSATVNNVILAYAVVITVLANFALVCGFYIERASIPSYWLWLHYISPLKYAYEALALNEFDRVTSLCYLSARDIYSSTPLSVLLDEIDMQRSLVALRPALIGSPFSEVSTSTCLQTAAAAAMDWFSAQVTSLGLGELPDIAGAVNKLSETVMNIDTSGFDGGLGLDFLPPVIEDKPAASSSSQTTKPRATTDGARTASAPSTATARASAPAAPSAASPAKDKAHEASVGSNTPEKAAPKPVTGTAEASPARTAFTAETAPPPPAGGLAKGKEAEAKAAGGGGAKPEALDTPPVIAAGDAATAPAATPGVESPSQIAPAAAVENQEGSSDAVKGASDAMKVEEDEEGGAGWAIDEPDSESAAATVPASAASEPVAAATAVSAETASEPEVEEEPKPTPGSADGRAVAGMGGDQAEEGEGWAAVIEEDDVITNGGDASFPGTDAGLKDGFKKSEDAAGDEAAGAGAGAGAGAADSTAVDAGAGAGTGAGDDGSSAAAAAANASSTPLPFSGFEAASEAVFSIDDGEGEGEEDGEGTPAPSPIKPSVSPPVRSPIKSPVRSPFGDASASAFPASPAGAAATAPLVPVAASPQADGTRAATEIEAAAGEEAAAEKGLAAESGSDASPAAVFPIAGGKEGSEADAQASEEGRMSLNQESGAEEEKVVTQNDEGEETDGWEADAGEGHAGKAGSGEAGSGEADPGQADAGEGADLATLESALQHAGKQAQTKADELARAMTLNDELRAELEDWKAKKNNDAELEALREEYQHRLGAAERKVYALTKERDMLRREQSRKADTSTLLKEKDEIIRQVMAEGEELSKKQAAQEGAMKKLRTQLREMEEERTRLQNRLQVEEARVESIKKDKAATEKALQDAVERGQADLAAQKDFYVSALSAAREAQAAAEARADSEAKAEAERKLREAGERERALVMTVEELRQALTRSEQQAGFREQMLRRDLEDMEKRCQAAEARHEELVARIPESTRPLLRQIEAMQESANTRMEALSGVERALNARLQEAEAKAAVAEERERVTSERLNQTLSRLAVMEAQLSCLRAEHSQLSRSLDKERQRAAENRTEYLSAQEAKVAAEGRVKVVEEEMREVKARWRKEVQEERQRRELVEQ
ncbi:unnamed protein product, partial [Closterium sp. Yama58-4]